MEQNDLGKVIISRCILQYIQESLFLNASGRPMLKPFTKQFMDCFFTGLLVGFRPCLSSMYGYVQKFKTTLTQQDLGTLSVRQIELMENALSARKIKYRKSREQSLNCKKAHEQGASDFQTTQIQELKQTDRRIKCAVVTTGRDNVRPSNDVEVQNHPESFSETVDSNFHRSQGECFICKYCVFLKYLT